MTDAEKTCRISHVAMALISTIVFSAQNYYFFNSPIVAVSTGVWLLIIVPLVMLAVFAMLWLHVYVSGETAIVKKQPWRRMCAGCRGKGRYWDLHGDQQCETCTGSGIVYPNLTDSDKLRELFFIVQLSATSVLFGGQISLAFLTYFDPSQLSGVVSMALSLAIWWQGYRCVKDRYVTAWIQSRIGFIEKLRSNSTDQSNNSSNQLPPSAT